MTLAEWRAMARARLASVGVPEAEREALALALLATGQDRAWVLAHGEWEQDWSDADRWLERRCAGEPLAYLRGSREFYGREFRVSPAVLIPRPETEHLVDHALAWRFPDGKRVRVLDVGTGSGCIAVTLAAERTDWTVVAVDVSSDALGVARDNARRHGVGVEFRQSDLARAWDGPPFDLIVSNPPYVGEGDELDVDVRTWEPSLALFAGPDGLEVYRRIALELPAVLAPGGVLMLEHGAGQWNRVAAVMTEAGWNVVEAWHDLAGHDRGLTLQLPSRLG